MPESSSQTAVGSRSLSRDEGHDFKWTLLHYIHWANTVRWVHPTPYDQKLDKKMVKKQIYANLCCKIFLDIVSLFDSGSKREAQKKHGTRVIPTDPLNDIQQWSPVRLKPHYTECAVAIHPPGCSQKLALSSIMIVTRFWESITFTVSQNV